jgi:Type II secretion system protein C
MRALASTPASNSSARADNLAPNSLALAELIAGQHLFGSAPAAPHDASPEADRGPPVSRWVLTGTLEARTPEKGLAMLGQTLDAVRLRGVGDSILEGYRLVQVFADHVVIEHLGERVALRLQKERLPGPAGSELLAQAAPPAYPPGPPPRRFGPAYNNPLAYQIFRPTASLGEDGRYQGVEVGRSLKAQEYGLQPHDVITQVNGHPMTNPGVALKLMRELSEAPGEITVLRDGVPQTITVALGGG